jgi:WD40 repeat protein
LNEAFSRELKREESYFYKLFFSPNGSLLVGFNDGVTVWSVATGEELFSFSAETSAITFSPDGKTLAISDYSGDIALYEMENGFPIKRLKQINENVRYIETIKFTPDGKKIISIERKNRTDKEVTFGGLNVVFWDVKTGMANLTETEKIKSSQFASLLSQEKIPEVFEFNESQMTVCYSIFESPSKRIERSLFLLNLESGVERKITQYNQVSLRIDFHEKILVMVIDGKLSFYESDTGKKISEFLLDDFIRVTNLSNDNSKLLVSKFNKILVINTKDGKVSKELANHSSMANARFSQDGKNLILERNVNNFQAIDLLNNTGVSKLKDTNFRESQNYTVKTWSLKTGKNTQTEDLNPQPVDGFNFPLLLQIRLISPDEKMYAFPDESTISGKISIRDAKDDHVIRTLEGHGESVEFVDFSFDGKILASGSKDETIKLWDVTTGEVLQTLSDYEVPDISDDDDASLPSALNSVCFSPDAKLIVGTTYNETATIWDVATGEVKQKLNHENEVIAVRFNLKGDKVATAGEEGDIKVWDVAMGKLLLSIKVPSEEDIYSVTFSDDDKFVASGGTDKVIRLWDIKNGKQVRELKGHKGNIHLVGIGEDIIASESSQSLIEIWDTEKGEIVRMLKDFNDRIKDVVLSPDRKLLATNEDSGIIKIWDVSNGKLKFELNKQGQTSDREYDEIVFSGDSSKLIGNDHGLIYVSTGKEIPRQIKIWSMKDGIEVYTSVFEKVTIISNTLSASFDAKWLSFKSPNSGLLLLNTETNQPPIQLNSGSYNGIVEFSNNGRFLANGNDELIEVWSIETNKLITVLRGHNAQIINLKFHPNSNILLSQSIDGTTKFWDLQNNREIGKLLLLDNEDWVVVSPEGLYDSSSEARKLINYVIELEPVTLNQMKDLYYVPGLLQKIFKGEPLPKVELFSKKDLFPDVEFSQPTAGQKDLSVKLTNRGGGIGQVQVLVNGKEFVKDARSKEFDVNAKEAVLTVSLENAPFVSGAENKIEVVVRNLSGSLTNRGTPRGTQVFNVGGTQQRETPNIYVIAGGISNYTGDNLKLNFAAKDAEDFAKAIELGAARLLGDKAKVHIRLLTSNGVSSKVKFDVPDAKISTATKKDFEQAFADFKDATPNDVFIVYLAGHGVSLNLNQNPTQAGGDTYLYLTQEATTTDKSVLSIENSRRAMAISSEELKDLMKTNKALKQVLILDTCAAGALSNSLVAKRDLPSDQIRAIERLKDNTGFYVLMGSSADAVSYEASQYGQGLLTYSLLQAMKGAKLRENQFADVNLLFLFAQETVPNMAKNIGGVQRPLIITPDISASFDIGKFTGEEQKLINLPNPKPIILRPTLQNKELDFDDLELTKLLQAKLREANYVAIRGENTPLVFVDADEMIDAIKPSGSYRVKSEEITVTIRLIKNKAPITGLTITGMKSDLSGLADKIIAEIIKETAKMS